MELNLPEPNLKSVAGAAGTALLLPLGMPIVHGVAGLAVAGLGVFAVTKVIGAFAARTEAPGAPEAHDEGPLEDRLHSPI